MRGGGLDQSENSADDREALANFARRGFDWVVADPLNVTCENQAGTINVTFTKSRKNSAVIVVGAHFPFAAPCGEQKSGAGRVQIINGCQQARHGTWLDNKSVKAPIGRFPLCNA